MKKFNKNATRYRELKKFGSGSPVIHLAPIDLKDLKWKIGDMIDITDCIAVSKDLYDLKFREDEEDKENEAE